MSETSNWHPSEGGAPPARHGSDAGERHIGPYRLLQRIGAGGMGEVWLAEQTAPVRRRVAVKLVKLGMDTRQVIARFEAERQALAMMDHPHIARVLDAGETDSGRPYFVMELVRGAPITQYCDDNHLTLRERLELFAQVCQAVQHAHQKAVIHRDLKPSNVLVSTVDGRPLAKVIDFGIAKATDHRLTDKTLFTELHQMIGTPAYMSPEQAGAALDIDTRTDVYSLGVMLYELLTGTPPFEARSLHAAAYDEIRRIIREVDPPTPSTRVRSLSSGPQAEGSGLSESRPSESDSNQPQTTAPRLHQNESETRAPGIHPGEPEAPAPCLHPSAPAAQGSPPSPREGSGGGPNAARLIARSSADSIARARRTDSVALCRMIRGELDWIVMKCLEKDRARRYESASALAMDIARHLRNEPVEAARPSTTYRVRKFVKRHRPAVVVGSIATVTILGAMLALSAISAWALHERALARSALESEDKQRRLAQTRERQLAKVADFHASMLADIDTKAMGELVVEEIGSSGRREEGSTEPSGAVAEETNPVSFNSTDIACRILDRSILRPSVLAIDEQFASDAVVRATLLSSIGASYQNLSMYDRAEPLLRTALQLRTESLGEAHPDTLRAMMKLGTLLHIASRPLEAEPLLRSALEGLTRAQGLDDPTRLSALNNLAWNLHEQGHLEEALVMYQEAYQRMSRVFGDADPTTLVALHNLGYVSHCLDKLDDSERYYRKGLEIIRRQPDDKTRLSAFLNSLGFVLTSKRQFQEADVLLHEAIDEAERTLGSDNRETLLARNSLAGSLKEQGRLDEARDIWEDVSRRAKDRLGDHWLTAVFLWEYAGMARRTGKFREAEAALLDNIGVNQRLGSDRRGNPDPSIRELVILYEEWNRAEPGKGMDLKAAEWTKQQAEPKP